MKIFAIAAAKGGSGKTTLALMLAAQAAQSDEAVTLLDLDRGQASLSSWWVLRGKPHNPWLEEIGKARSPRVVLRDAERAGRTVAIIDTAPGSIERVEEAAAVADAVLIPVRPSFFDVLAIETTADICRKAGAAFAFVLMDVDSRFPAALVNSCERDLRTFGPVFATRTAHKQAYVIAPSKGQSAAEFKRADKALSDEAEGIWREALALVEGAKS
jgi:chromosome partitioning protein